MALAMAAALLAGPAQAGTPALTLAGHVFTPGNIIVPANTRFTISVTSHDATPDEFESPDLRVEKILMPGQTITVHAGPLAPGSYQFFDDFHPESAHGIVLAQ